MQRLRTRLAGALPAVPALTATACGGSTAAAEELTERSEQRIAAVREDVSEEREKPRGAFPHLRDSASVYLIGGRGSGAASLIEAAGALDVGAESGLDKDFKGLESVGGIDGLVEIPGVARTPAGTDRRVVSVEDGVLLNHGPRTDQVLKSVVAQLYKDGGE